MGLPAKIKFPFIQSDMKTCHSMFFENIFLYRNILVVISLSKLSLWTMDLLQSTLSIHKGTLTDIFFAQIVLGSVRRRSRELEHPRVSAQRTSSDSESLKEVFVWSSCLLGNVHKRVGTLLLEMLVPGRECPTSHGTAIEWTLFTMHLNNKNHCFYFSTRMEV